MPTGGEKAWSSLLMFKALLLQSWYDLSDPQLEKQLATDLLFRRFVKLDLSESVPVHITFFCFRQKARASWNVKNGSDGKRKSTYGFKAHLNVDEDGLIKATDYSTGSSHNSNHYGALLSGKESAVYADSAYQSEKHKAWLSEQGIDNRLTRRAYRNRALLAEDKQFNRLHLGVRSTVKHVFGVLKQHYGMAKARYLI